MNQFPDVTVQGLVLNQRGVENPDGLWRLLLTGVSFWCVIPFKQVAFTRLQNNSKHCSKSQAGTYNPYYHSASLVSQGWLGSVTEDSKKIIFYILCHLMFTKCYLKYKVTSYTPAILYILYLHTDAPCAVQHLDWFHLSLLPEVLMIFI